MTSYTYTERNGIHIIDLRKTVGMVGDTYEAVMDIVAAGDTTPFVGTKKQAQDVIKEEAECCGQSYVNERWLGGMLTNFKTTQSRVKRLHQTEEMSQGGTFDRLPKKEVTEPKKEPEKLRKNLDDIKDMKKIPDAIMIIDPKKGHICITGVHGLNIPLIGIADASPDPEELTYVTPGSDSVIRAVRLIASRLMDAVVEAHQDEKNRSEEVAEGDDVVASAIKAAIEANAW